MPNYTPEEILAAAGLSDLTGPRADFAYRKIIDDHEVLAIAERLSREAFIVAALQSMDSGQRSRLAKRTRPEPAPVVRWAVTIAPVSQRPMIKATFGGEEVFFDGAPEKAAHFVWHGEKPPLRLLEEYAKEFDPNAPTGMADYWAQVHHKEPRAPHFVPGVGWE